MQVEEEEKMYFERRTGWRGKDKGCTLPRGGKWIGSKIVVVVVVAESAKSKADDFVGWWCQGARAAYR